MHTASLSEPELTPEIMMQNIQTENNIAPLSTDSGQDPPAKDQGDNPKPKTRLETARERLSKEKYLELKGIGKSDQHIRILYKIASDTMITLKREWEIPIGQGLVIESTPPAPSMSAVENADEIQSRIENIREHLSAQAAAPGLTIAQAMELRDELLEDIDDYNHIISESKEAHLSERVIMAIGLQRDIHIQTLDRINEVFDSTVVQL